MMKAGVPLSKVDLFRDVLEEHGYALTSSTNLRQLIPFVHQEELSGIKQEILNQPLSIIFGGTTHVCEALVVVLRYLTDDWELKQCVGRLKLLAKTITRSRLLWRTQTSLSAPSYSSTQWWSQFEVIDRMLKTFSDVKKFLERDDLPPATSTKLLQVLDDPAKTRKLKSK